MKRYSFPARGAVTAAALIATALASAQPSPRDTATTAATSDDELKDVLELDAFLVTAATRPGTTKMKSSVSVSTLGYDKVQSAAPRSTAEIFRSLPGFRAEATSGDGNANITVRGLPLSAGGSRYVLLQEDGVPVLQFGDIAFGTADQFLRADATLALVETVRGGSASTAASNSPGGVINFISKTGETPGGSLQYTRGLDYDEDRVEFDYGSPLSDSLRFHVGGFYRGGEGVRETGYTGNRGGQLKANLTKSFSHGYVRLYLKALDDHATTYMPMPTRTSGTNGSPGIGSLPGYDVKRDTLQSAFFRSALTIDGAGNPRVVDITDGIHTRDTSIGAELSFELPEGWNVSNRFAYSEKSGQFVTQFPADVGPTADLAASVAGAGATAVYANGPSAGAAYSGAHLMRVHLFNTPLNDFDTFSNNLKLDRTFTLGEGTLTPGLGYYRASQNIDMDWLWNTYIEEVRGGGRAALVDIRDAAGATVTTNGLVAYGMPAWGNFGRAYDVTYDISAPFASLTYVAGRLNLDASVRRDTGEARGAWFDTTTSAMDVDRNGTISRPEQNATVINRAAPKPIRYDWNYTSYSFGSNYSFTPDLAGFARYSKGGRAGADRIVDFLNSDGSLIDASLGVNLTRQLEVGLKYRTSTLIPGNLGLFATFFNAKTDEASNFEATTQRALQRNYEASGVELEFAYSYDWFDLRGGITYTDAEITGADVTSLVGNRPRRQARWVYQLTPSVTTGAFSLGASVIGTTDSYAQDDNLLVMPGYTYVNLFAGYRLTRDLSVTLNVNNLFDTFGLSESEDGSIPASGIIRARGITGRTTSLALRYTF